MYNFFVLNPKPFLVLVYFSIMTSSKDLVFLIPSEARREDESLKDVAIHNLKISDEHFDLPKFSESAMAWMKCHPKCGFDDLESFLRANNFNTYVFARKPPPPTTIYDLQNPNFPDMTCEWMIYFSCRPPPHAKNEVLKHCSSLKENSDRLATGGFAMSSSASDKNLPENVKLFDIEEMSDALKISQGKKKLVATKKSKSAIYEETLRKVTALNGNRKPKRICVCSNLVSEFFAFQFDNGTFYPVAFDAANNRYDLVSLSLK